MEDLLKKKFQLNVGGKILFHLVKEFFIQNDISDNIFTLLNQIFNTNIIAQSRNRKFVLNLTLKTEDNHIYNKMEKTTLSNSICFLEYQ